MLTIYIKYGKKRLMKKKTKRYLGIGLALLFLVVMGTFILMPERPFAIPQSSGVFDYCTWQPIYWWVSCVPDERSQAERVVLSSSVPIQCPDTAGVYECLVDVIDLTDGSYDTRLCDSCRQGMFGWTCSNCIENLRVGDKVRKGQWLWQLIRPPIHNYRDTEMRVYRKYLLSNGESASGYGELVPDSQGCSWKPVAGKESPDERLDDDPLSFPPIDITEIRRSIRFPYGQRLLTCPSECTIDTLCAVPSHLRHGTTFYQGRMVNYYVSAYDIHYVGCKSMGTFCDKYNEAGKCIGEEFEYRECGTLGVDPEGAGSCARDGDCGDINIYYCKWDEANLKGVCDRRDSPDTTISDCQDDFDCQSRGGVGACNNKLIGEGHCVDNKCVVTSKPVGCCTSRDCDVGFFCNDEFECEEEQQQREGCPSGKCCENLELFQDRTCEDMTGGVKPVCCGRGKKPSDCVVEVSECKPDDRPAGECAWYDIICHLSNFFNNLFRGIFDFFNMLFTIFWVIVIVIIVWIIVKIARALRGRPKQRVVYGGYPQRY